ncbi:MAG: tetratricopeptide repeat protein [Pirellulaceae bacterium]
MTTAADTHVRVWREAITIATYGVGVPDRNPMFLEKRVYQGSSGTVYPLPVIDRIFDDKSPRVYDAVFLENEFLKVMILPELGGRVQMAFDKTNQYHFLYYNRVIKPALVGLAGPWLSGGLEFNWPQHHRPSTFMPVDCETVANPDGSQTVWCSEIERLQRTKGMHGFTLYPDKAYLEIKVRLFNRSPQPQTFLWWANPAVHANAHHQSIFPPDVHAVMDHGKRDVSGFPIATGTYYKVDYAPGTDISRYRNIPVPTSYMAYRSAYDFVGSYDHGRQAGLLHIASHHIAPGKKQWTWGTGDFGRAWDRELTDKDGPYVELMCGAYTDNQPDFSWLMPGEEKSFSQYFMPYKGVGVIKNATLDAAVSLEFTGGRGVVRAYTTSRQPGCRAVVSRGDSTLWEATFDGSPATSFEAFWDLEASVDPCELHVAILNAAGEVLVSWHPESDIQQEVPTPAKAIDPPEQLDSVESLFLAGLHLEQYRHATRRPEDYYQEGLRRDRGDVRCNNALGRLLLRRGCFADAEPFFRAAIDRLTRHNPNPYDGEPYYNLGLALVMQSRWDAAYDAFYKSTWNAAWQDAAYFQLARLALRRGDFNAAQGHLDQCLGRHAHHHQARHLHVFLLAHSHRTAAARDAMEAELVRDPFNTGVLYELSQIDSSQRPVFVARMRVCSHNYLELALDYAAAGLYARAVAVLEDYLQQTGSHGDTPMVHYYLADFHRSLGSHDKAARSAADAAGHCPDYCFPSRLESIAVLTAAIHHDPQDARASYYLGNLWYHNRQYEKAIACWQRARELDPQFATVWRNLGLAYFNKRQDAQAAWQAMEQAFALDRTDARVLYELDQLARRLGHAAAPRLARLVAHRDVVLQRDDLYLERVTLLNLLGQHQEALDLLLQRRFHPWEGGEGKVPAQFTLAITQLARAALAEGRFRDALALLERTRTWPESLGEGKLASIQENNVLYWRGCAHRGLQETAAAETCFRHAIVGLGEPASAMYYNDQPPDMIFYQGLARRALGDKDQADRFFERLLHYGREHLHDHVEIDYFAVSLPDFLVFEDDLQLRNEVHCRYMMALGCLGLGQQKEAAQQFEVIGRLDANHMGVMVHQTFDTKRD